MTFFFLIVCLMLLCTLGLLAAPLLRAKAWYWLVGLCVAMPLLLILFYYQWGTGSSLKKWVSEGQYHFELEREFTHLGTPDEMIQRFEEKAKLQPNDAKTLYLLGKLCYSSGRYEDAVKYIDKANSLSPNVPRIMVAYADALFMTEGRKNGIRAYDLTRGVLVIEPTNIEALSLMARMAYAEKAYDQSIVYWRKILKVLPADDPRRDEYNKAIQALKKREGL